MAATKPKMTAKTSSKTTNIMSQSKLSSSRKFNPLLLTLLAAPLAAIGVWYVVGSHASTPHRLIYGDVNGYANAVYPDGTGGTKLSTGSSYERYSDESIDGIKIVASDNEWINGAWHRNITIVNTDGTSRKRITNTSLPSGQPTTGSQVQYDDKPSFKPVVNSTKVLYTRFISTDTLGHGSFQTRVVNTDGTNDHAVGPVASQPMPAHWIPGTDNILLNDATGQFYSFKSDGTSLTKLAKLAYQVPEFAVSPGTIHHILYYQAGGTAADQGLFTMNIDGTKQVHAVGPVDLFGAGANVTLSFGRHGVWNPSGNNFTFVAYTLTTGISHPTQSTVMTSSYTGQYNTLYGSTMSFVTPPMWSYDGTKLGFSTITYDAAHTLDVYTLDPDGKNLLSAVTSKLADGFTGSLQDGWGLAAW